MLLALVPLLQLLAGGASIGAATAALSIPQWIAIGTAALSALPSEVEAAQSIHDVLDNVIGNVLKAGVSTVASEAAANWLADNGQAAIRHDPGIGSES